MVAPEQLAHILQSREQVNAILADRKRREEEEARKRTFNFGNIVGGVLGTALSPLTGGLSLAPLLLSAGGEATRAATGSDMPLADIAMAAGKYLPTGPQAATQSASSMAKSSLQPTMGAGQASAQPSFWDNLQGGIGNVGEGLRQTMWMPETYEASQNKKAFADLQGKYGDQMRMSSVTDPISRASYTVDKPADAGKLTFEQRRQLILLRDRSKTDPVLAQAVKLATLDVNNDLTMLGKTPDEIEFAIGSKAVNYYNVLSNKQAPKPSQPVNNNPLGIPTKR